MKGSDSWQLARNGFGARRGPLVVVVMDGVGIGKGDEGDAVARARKPVLEGLWRDHPTIPLRAHGVAVGLPTEDDMGNSEVGHNALGAGRVFDQGAKRVGQALRDGSLFAGAVWRALTAQCRERGTPLHLIGLLSDGNVHSHVDQLHALIRRAHEEGVAKLRVHPLLDGRDVGGQTALIYLDALERLLAAINATPGRDYCIASGGGRMHVTMDRYEANWPVVEHGWKAHVLGQGRRFASARQAVETFRGEDPGANDQFLGEFVIERDGQPVGTIEDDHAVVLFNFRGDRAIQITRAFEDASFTPFDRVRVPRVLYAGMMQYDGDLGLPKRYLVEPPTIDRTLGEYLARNGIRQFACSETQKYGHVTYFWNGNRSGKFDEALETYVEVPSDRVPFEERPWMRAAEITDATIAALEGGATGLLRINYANGDMVGHTGSLNSTLQAVEAVDLCLGRLLRAVTRVGGIALVTADHGNADQMYELKKSGAIERDEAQQPRIRTAHSLNAVPFTIFDPAAAGEYQLVRDANPGGLSNVAATALWLMGYQAPAEYDAALVRPTSGRQ
ncbi:MAG: 2,3-bisphosphoglycerate-independent phosphoglycerate mutase [Proteobacteria bacterium]|nr:2,3-bisphosphoglycerate-independent phosphoglycerate mutase [Pseudomonadota bacterium]